MRHVFANYLRKLADLIDTAVKPSIPERLTIKIGLDLEEYKAGLTLAKAQLDEVTEAAEKALAAMSNVKPPRRSRKKT